MPVSQEETYVWPSSTSNDETYLVGQDSTVIGDSTDSANLLLKLLFNANPYQTIIRQANTVTAIAEKDNNSTNAMANINANVITATVDRR